MPLHNSSTNLNHIDFYKHRAKNVNLIWCGQIINLLEKITSKNKNYTINDIGCNYGQLYKEIKRNKLEKRYDYFGYDHDDKFLDIARENFIELKNKIQILDIEKETPPSADITICSAVFEHLDNPMQSLSHLFNCTKKHIILRTWVGLNDIRFIQSDSRFVDQPYNVNQYGLFEMSKKFFEGGFSLTCIPDHATEMSKKYEVFKGSGINRQMYILLGSRNEK
jgi:SAM-dependent methyltransferase